jgi:cytochrome c553
MTYARPLLMCAALLGALFALPAMAAGDPVAGREKSSMCEGCHGIPGWRTAYPAIYSVPKLGGQHQDYIVAALKEYKSGEREFPTMHAIASGLSDQDMQDLAAYYASSYSGPANGLVQ